MEAVSAASVGSDQPIRVGFHLITAAALLLALVVVFAVFEGSRPDETLAEGPLPLGSEIRFTPDLNVEGPTTLTVALEREPRAGFAGVGVSLLHRESGEVRQLVLASNWVPTRAGAHQGSLSAVARVDEVASGTWIARLEPGWEPLEGETAEPPAATIRIRQEPRSPMHFWVAAGLVVLPALVQIGRYVWYTRRRAGETNSRGGER